MWIQKVARSVCKRTHRNNEIFKVHRLQCPSLCKEKRKNPIILCEKQPLLMDNIVSIINITIQRSSVAGFVTFRSFSVTLMNKSNAEKEYFVPT